MHPLFVSCTKPAPSCHKKCLLPLLPAEKSGPCSAVSCGFRIDEPRKKRYTIFRRCSCAAGCRGVAQLVARLLWEQEAASSSLATPTTRKATMNRLQMRFCRGFLCFQNPEIWLECALFVPYRPKKCLTRRPDAHIFSGKYAIKKRTCRRPRDG